MAFYKWPDGSVRATRPPGIRPTKGAGTTTGGGIKTGRGTMGVGDVRHLPGRSPTASSTGGNWWNDGANTSDPMYSAFEADMSSGWSRDQAGTQGWFDAKPAGMSYFDYWKMHHNDPGHGSGSGGSNVFAGRAGEFMTNFGTPAPTYTPYNVAMPAYKPFTAADFQADPGYAFRQAEGKRAVEGSAAARGGFFSGQTGIDLGTMGQNIASQEWQNSYNRYQGDYQNKFQNWQTGYNVNMQDQNNALNSWQNQFNTWNTQQTNQFNRLADISGMGQTAANDLGSAGFGAANTAGNYMTNIGNAQATGINAAAGFNAAGNVNLGNQMMGYAGNAMYQPYISKMWGG